MGRKATGRNGRRAKGPLDGVRVLDVASFLAGPFGATVLGDLGADVIKVESPTGEESRQLGPTKNGEHSPFLAVNRNKRDIVLDLQLPAARKVFRRLVATADVLITNVREPALSRLGLDYASVRKQRGDIIWAGVTAFGADGPYAGRPGIDFLAQGFGGLIAMTGRADEAPVRISVPMVDVMTSLLVSSSVLAALYERTSSGKGQRIDISLLDAVVHAQSTGLANLHISGEAPRRTGNRSLYFAPSGVYECADGKSICITCPTEKFFRNLCDALDASWSGEDRFRTIPLRQKHEEELDAEIAARVRQFPRALLLKKLLAADVMAAPVNDLPDVVADPQARHNGMIANVDHATIGKLQITGVPMHLGRTPASVRLAPPVLGEHTREILKELGYTKTEVDALIREGVAAEASLPNKRKGARR
jgi:crotonobetainyl-CoA:carnitine CoA-transferase CaiB-like acyl-CoA transferase